MSQIRPAMSDRALAQQTAQAQEARARKWSRAVMLLSALVLSFAAVGLVVVDQMLRPDVFVIDQLKIKGRFAHLKPTQIEEVVLRYKSGNFFSVNLSEIQSQVEAMRWVDTAEVRREWPNTLTVSVMEHKPVMKLNDNAWVNLRGQVVDLPEYQTQKPVVKLSGEASEAKSMMVKALLWSKRLESHSLILREVKLSKSGAWSLRLRYHDDTDSSPDEFELLLGNEEIDARLVRFEQLFDRRFRFSQERLLRADTRYPDGIAVQTKPVAHKSQSQDGNELALKNQQEGSSAAALNDIEPRFAALGST